MGARRGNVYRLPLPPRIGGTISTSADDLQVIHKHISDMTIILNQGLQSLQQRINTVQQTGARTPPTVTGLTVTGKQGLFYLTWNRVANVDGYVVTRASDSAMKILIGRYNLPDSEQCTLDISVGNVAVTNSFQVYAYQGPKYSEPSPSVTATTSVYGSAEAAPANPPIAPRQPKIAPVRNGPNLP